MEQLAAYVFYGVIEQVLQGTLGHGTWDDVGVLARHRVELVLKLAHQRHDLTAGYVLEPLDGLSRCKLLSGEDDLEVSHLLALVTVMPSAFWSADLAPAQQLAQVADDNRLEAVPFLDRLQMSLVIVFDEPKHAVGSAQAIHGARPLRVAPDPFDWPHRC